MSDEHVPDPNRWRALAVCLVGGFMVLLDVSIVNVALPSIRSGLGASDSDLQWIVSGYALTFGLLLVPAGRVGDLWGRRTVFVGALGMFTLASAACGAAPTPSLLIAARLVQGLAGGILTPQIAATIQELFQGKERARAFGWFGSVVGISTAIGPLLGGVLIEVFGDHTGWRAVFFVNIPIGLVAMPFAWRLLPKANSAKKRKHDLDPVGVILLGIGAVLLLLPFVQERTWSGAAKWLLVPAALLVLTAFVVWDLFYKRRGKEPLVELELFRLRSYSFGVGLISLYFAGFTPLFFVFTLFLQTGQQYSALLAGLAITPFAIGSGVASGIGGRIVDRLGRKVVLLGLVLVVVGFVGTLYAARLYPEHHTGLAMLVPLLIAGLGNGLVISPNQTLTVSEVPVRYAGTANGLLQTGQRIGAAVGIAAVGSAFFTRLSDSRGDFPGSFEHGLLIALLFVGAALVVCLVEIVIGRGRHQVEQDAPRIPVSAA
ncbi:MAG: MFS transporter [Jatrophihabitans sp.]